jgi:hypothetical protein
VPLAFWQSSQAHMNIDLTGPAKCTVTAPQAQLALRSTTGLGFLSMGQSCTGPGRAARRLI